MLMFRRVLKAILGAIIIVGLSWGVYIHLSYSSTMPNSPHPEVGRIYPMKVNHGYLVYVTKEEFEHADFVLNKVFYVWIGSIVLLTVLSVSYRKS